MRHCLPETKGDRPLRFGPRFRRFWNRPLLADFQTADDLEISLRIDVLEIVQKAAPSADHHQQATPAGVVLLMRPQVLGQLADTRGQDGDLHLGRSGVAFATPVVPDKALLAVFGHHRVWTILLVCCQPFTLSQPVYHSAESLQPQIWPRPECYTEGLSIFPQPASCSHVDDAITLAADVVHCRHVNLCGLLRRADH